MDLIYSYDNIVSIKNVWFPNGRPRETIYSCIFDICAAVRLADILIFHDDKDQCNT